MIKKFTRHAHTTTVLLQIVAGRYKFSCCDRHKIMARIYLFMFDELDWLDCFFEKSILIKPDPMIVMNVIPKKR